MSRGGPTNFEGMSHVRFDNKTSIDDSVEADRQHPSIPDTVRRKQLEVLQNPTLKTSLTTNIRNIMRNQDKGLLTTSTRLLNAQVKRAELKSEIEKQERSMSPTDHRMSVQSHKVGAPSTSKKAISTVDLLRK